MTKFVGIDPALSATGLAWWDCEHRIYTHTITTPSIWIEPRRQQRIMGHIWSVIAAAPAIVVMEDVFIPRMNKTSARTAIQLAGLRSVISYGLFVRNIPLVMVTDTTVKKFATGNGHADKPAVMAAAEYAVKYKVATDHEADALWLLLMALVRYGVFPLLRTHAQLATLDTLSWPQLPTPPKEQIA